jgi:hypothetical protein
MVAGGHDNISVILLEFDEVNVAATPIRRTMSSAPPPATPTTRPASAGRRRRIVTWRVWAATFLFLAIVAGGVVVIHWYAYSTYYLGEHDGMVAIFRGQPSGVLWYKPEVLAETTPVKYLRIQDRRALNATIPEPTERAAITFAKSMYDNYERGQTSTTTTTTKPGTTTTAAVG